MRVLLGLVAAFATFACGSCAEQSPPEPLRVLFVGNSLTYVGNLPAVMDALSNGRSRSTSSDMIVTGGATLTDRVTDGSVARALAAQRYSVVVLQERGGDFACGFGPDVCVNSRESLTKLAEVIREHGATAILLGTYQVDPRASMEIIKAESKAAATSGVAYVSVSARLMELRTVHPEMAWFASDGMHPGPDLTLLNAVLLFQEIHGTSPAITEVAVHAPIYSYESLLHPVVRRANASADLAETEPGITYESRRIRSIVEELK